MPVLENADHIVKTVDLRSLHLNDIIRSADNIKINSVKDLSNILKTKAAGDTIDLVIDRKGSTVEIPSIRLGAKGEKVVAVATKGSTPAGRQKGELGIFAEEKEDGSVVVTEIKPGGAAELKPEDVIVQVQGTKINGFDDMIRVLKNVHAGDKISVVVRREGAEKSLEIVLRKK